MGGDPFETEQIYYVTKVFDAVARAVKALGRQYIFLKPESWPKFRLPSPTYLPDSPFPANVNGSSVKLQASSSESGSDSCTRGDTLTAIVNRSSLPITRAGR